MSRHCDFDVIIVGAGLVGMTLALALAGAPLRIALVEAEPAGRRPDPDRARPFVLAYGSMRILADLGLWDAVAEHAIALRTIHVTERGRFGVTRITAADAGVEALGYVVRSDFLSAALTQSLHGLPGITHWQPATVERVSARTECLSVAVREAAELREYSCKLLVAADGTHSAIRRLMGIPARHVYYGQTAVVGQVSAQKSHGHSAYLRFLGDGALAMLPLSDQRMGMVWTVSRQKAQSMLDDSDAVFSANLQQHFGYRLGSFSALGPRSMFPLSLTYARPHLHARVITIGNAAQTLHPVAAQGLNLGLRDAALLAEQLHSIATAREDCGGAEMMQRFEHSRKRDRQHSILLTDGLARLFSSTAQPWLTLRQCGRLAVDALPPLKQLLTRQTLGLTGRLPRSPNYRK